MAAAAAVEKEASQQSTLGAYSPVDYMSITSFPRLPEEEAAAEGCLRSRKEEDAFLGEQDTDPDSFLKSARLQRLPSSSSEMGSQDVSPLRETSKDPFSGDCSCRQDGLTVIITACLTFAMGVTVALIMQIYFGDPQIFHQGAVVTDAARCTALGIEVLNKQGSSVDAAIAAALCAGIINPHTSGIGGVSKKQHISYSGPRAAIIYTRGGVMLVHDIRKNESQVIDFRETAPSGIQEEGLREAWEIKPGLLVGVPGMIQGMHKAHQSHGRLPWSELLGLAANIARDGFNVTHDLARAITELKELNYSDKFRETFLPEGQPLLPGMFMKRLDLATILHLVGSEGVSAFYSGNLTQEIISEVHNYGGVLSEEDFSNYNALVENPVHTVYQGHLVLSPPPPHAGPALITALNILEGFNISQITRENTLHWIAETLKIALELANSLGDPGFNASIYQSVEDMVSKSKAGLLRQQINDSQAVPSGISIPQFSTESDSPASQVLVMGPDDYIVAVFPEPPIWKWNNNALWNPSKQPDVGLFLAEQHIEPLVFQPDESYSARKKTLSFLLPTIVRPSDGMCGTYLCLGANNGDKALSSITQVLVNVLTLNKNLSESLSLGRLHPQVQSNILQVDSEFPEEDIEFLEARGHQVDKVDVLSLVHGARRTNNFIIGVKDPRSMDAAGATIL